MYSRGSTEIKLLLLRSSMTHAQEGMLSYFHRFSVSVWKGENDSNTLRVDAYVLEDREKNLRFQKYPGPVIEGFTRIYIKDERII